MRMSFDVIVIRENQPMPAITVRLSDEKLKEIDELADAMDRSRTWVVTDALARYLDVERQWLERVRAGQASIARGEGVPHGEVMDRLRAKVTAHEGKEGE